MIVRQAKHIDYISLKMTVKVNEELSHGEAQNAKCSTAI